MGHIPYWAQQSWAVSSGVLESLVWGTRGCSLSLCTDREQLSSWELALNSRGWWVWWENEEKQQQNKGNLFTLSFCKPHRLVSLRKDASCPPSATGDVLALGGGLCQGQGQKQGGEKTLRRTQQYKRDLSELFHLLRAPEIPQVTFQMSWSISAGFGLWIGNCFTERWVHWKIHWDGFVFHNKRMPEFCWWRAEHGGGAQALHFDHFPQKNPNYHVLTSSVWHWLRQVTHQEGWKLPLHILWKGVLWQNHTLLWALLKIFLEKFTFFFITFCSPKK